MTKNFEDLSRARLDPDTEAELLRAQTECTFVWHTKTGHPLGVIMSFVYHDDRFWLTASATRGRVAAVRADPRVAIVVSSLGSAVEAGKSLTCRGTCTVRDDEETKRWFFEALSLRRFPHDEGYRATFVEKLDSSQRVILEVETTERITYDGAKLHGPGRHAVDPDG
jgi:nitroimidazol reductase NimA-like FMN-containing flavoprotein (pyridoxamine 5'-phosphate oxidase superfamily)